MERCLQQLPGNQEMHFGTGLWSLLMFLAVHNFTEVLEHVCSAFWVEALQQTESYPLFNLLSWHCSLSAGDRLPSARNWFRCAASIRNRTLLFRIMVLSII